MQQELKWKKLKDAAKGRNGSEECRRTAHSIHSRDKHGKCACILFDEEAEISARDQNLEPFEDGFVFCSNAYRAQFSKEGGRPLSRIVRGEYSLEMRMEPSENSSQMRAETEYRRPEEKAANHALFKETNTQISAGYGADVWEGNFGMQTSRGCCRPEVTGANRLVFKEAEVQADLEYRMEPNRLKENIVVHARSDHYRYMFTLQTAGLFAEKAGETIVFKSVRDGAAIFRIPAPVMTDAAGEESESVRYRMREESENLYRFVVEADPAWINAEERVFPVAIDPQIVTSSDAFIRVNAAESAIEIRLQKLISEAFDEHTRFTKAVLELNALAGVAGETYEVKVNYSRDGVDYLSLTGGNEKLFVDLSENFNQAIKASVGIPTGEDLLVRVQFENTRAGGPKLKINEQSGMLPLIMVDYLPERSEFDERSYYAFDVKEAGAGRVNLLNGQVQFVHESVSPENLGAPLPIAHVYNSIDGAWKLNLDQRLVSHRESENTFLNLNGNLSVYHDGLGAQHTFIEKYYYTDEASGEKIYVEPESEEALGKELQCEVCSDSGMVLDTLESKIFRVQNTAVIVDRYALSIPADGGAQPGLVSYLSRPVLKDEETDLFFDVWFSVSPTAVGGWYTLTYHAEDAIKDGRLIDAPDITVQSGTIRAPRESYYTDLTLYKETKEKLPNLQKAEEFNAVSALKLPLTLKSGYYHERIDVNGYAFNEEIFELSESIRELSAQQEQITDAIEDCERAISGAIDETRMLELQREIFDQQKKILSAQEALDALRAQNSDLGEKELTLQCDSLQQSIAEVESLIVSLNKKRNSKKNAQELTAAKAQHSALLQQLNLARRKKQYEEKSAPHVRAAESAARGVETLQQALGVLQLMSSADAVEKNRDEARRQVALLNDRKIKNALLLKQYETLRDARIAEEETKPKNFLHSTDGLVYGFNLGGKLVSIEAEGASTQIKYDEDGRILRIENSAGGVAVLDYAEDGSLKQITDPQGRVYRYTFQDGMLQEAEAPDGETSVFRYENGRLCEIQDTSGFGVLLTFDRDGSLQKMTTFTYTESIGSEQTPATERMSDKILSFSYIPFESANVRDKYGNVLGYIFDAEGRTVTQWNNAGGMQVETHCYLDDKIRLEAQSFPLAGNLIPETSPLRKKEKIEDETYLIDSAGAEEPGPTRKNSNYFYKPREAGAGDERASCNYTSFHTEEEIGLAGDISDARIFSDRIIASDIADFPHGKCLILSGWAKAEHALITGDTRKFELRIDIVYAADAGLTDRNQTESFSFDWRTGGWQYIAFPVLLKRDCRVLEFTVTADFSYNRGDVLFKSIALSLGTFSKTELNAEGLPVVRTDETGRTEYRYTDKKAPLEIVFTPANEEDSPRRTRFSYDSEGRLLLEEDEPSGMITEYVYTDGALSESFCYHKQRPAEKMRTELPAPSATVFGFDRLNDRLLQVSAADDGLDNLQTLRYHKGYLTGAQCGHTHFAYRYDGFGNLLAVSKNGKPVLRLQKSGLKQQTVFEGGPVFEAETNKKGRLIHVKRREREGAEQTLWQQYFYAPTGELLSMVERTDEGELRHDYTYDQEARVTALQRGADTVQYVYDEDGRLCDKHISCGRARLTQTFAYTKDGALSSVSVPGVFLESLACDAFGRPCETLVKAAGGSPVTGQTISYRKQADTTMGLIAEMRYRNGALVSEHLRYRYDEQGRITEVRGNGLPLARYRYDSLGRLAREDNAAFRLSKTFGYDAAGNLLQVTTYAYTTDERLEAHPVVSHRDYRYAADAPDELLSIVSYENGKRTETLFADYDALGCPSRYAGATLTWDVGRLMSWTHGSKQLTFGYNTNGVRLFKSVGGAKTRYTLEGSDVLAIDSPLGSMTVLKGASGTIGLQLDDGTLYFFRKNAQGDVTHLIDASGEAVVQYVYDAWGNHSVLDLQGQPITDETHPGHINPFRYRGYLFDTETGLYYCGSRYYDPTIGRWVSADSLEYLEPTQANGLNLYAYCGNDPVSNIDPNGHAFFSLLIAIAAGAFIGTIIGGGFELGSQLIAGNGFDWTQIGWAALGGLAAGALTAIPIPGTGFLSYLGTFALGAAGTLTAGAITGSIDFSSGWSIASGILVGGFANVAARGISNGILGNKANKISNLSRQPRKNAIMQLQQNKYNMGKAAHHNLRNVITKIGKNEIAVLLSKANPFFRYGIYSSFNSAFISGFPYMFK